MHSWTEIVFDVGKMQYLSKIWQWIKAVLYQPLYDASLRITCYDQRRFIQHSDDKYALAHEQVVHFFMACLHTCVHPTELEQNFQHLT